MADDLLAMERRMRHRPVAAIVHVFVATCLLLGAWGNAAADQGQPADLADHYLVMAVANSTGIYQTAHLMPVGMTCMVEAAAIGTSWELIVYGSGQSVGLAPVAAGEFAGDSERQVASGPFGAMHLREHWTLSITRTGITIRVGIAAPESRDRGLPPSAASTPAWSGHYVARLMPRVVAGGEIAGHYWQSHNRHVGGCLDARFTGEGCVLGLSDAGFYNTAGSGTSGVLWFDAANGWSEVLYVPVFYRDGDRLIGSARYGADSHALRARTSAGDDDHDVFAVVTVQLDRLGVPESTSVKGLAGYGRDERKWSLASGAYTDQSDVLAAYAKVGIHPTLEITDITAGGVLAGLYGPAGSLHEGFLRQDAATIYFNLQGRNWINLWAGHDTRRGRRWVLWNPMAYHDGGLPYWDLDGDASTIERLTVDVRYEGARPVSGTVLLQVYTYDPVGDRYRYLRHERMAFAVIPSADG
jgi:hypothetical protein